MGAEVLALPSHRNGITPELIQEMKILCAEKVNELDGFYANQFGLKYFMLGYKQMGIEIADQIDGELDLLFAFEGSGGALMGTLYGLCESGLSPKTVALEPLQSTLLSKGKSSSHKVEGISVGFYPPFLDK